MSSSSPQGAGAGPTTPRRTDRHHATPIRSLSTATSIASFQGMASPTTPRAGTSEHTSLMNGRDDMEQGLTPLHYGSFSENRERDSRGGDDSRDGASLLPSGATTPRRNGKDSQRWTKRLNYYVPATSWIPNYSLSLLAGDVLAGLTVSSMLIPQSVSYGSSLAKLSPVTGLFSAAIPGIIYALLGSSKQLNVAPEAALSLLVGQSVSDFLHSDPHGHPEDADAIGFAVATAITLQVGLFSFILGFFRLGFVDVVLSRALLRGFVTAIAVVITVEQLIPMFGLGALEHHVNPQTTLDKITFLIENVFSHSHRPTAFISFGMLLALIVLRAGKSWLGKYWWVRRLPEVLIVVVISTVMSDRLKWDQLGVEILGAVPIHTGKHFFEWPFQETSRRYIRGTTSTAILISIIGFLDSIVAAKQNGDRYGHPISPNRELVALGAGNLAASFIPGTLPAFGSIVRSRINGEVGGRTQMASLVCSVIVLLATFFLLPWLYFLPKCVLASIICLVVFSLFAEVPHDLLFYWRIRAWTDLALMFLTFTFSVIWNVEIGIVVSLIVSLLLVVRRSSKTRMTILGRIPGTDSWKPLSDNPDAEDIPGTLIVRIRESLDFANTSQLKERLRRLELYGIDPHHPSEDPRRQPAKVLVFHMADVESCDASAVQILYELLVTYKARSVTLLITHLRPGPKKMFVRAGIVSLLGPGAFYGNLAEAVAGLGGEARNGVGER